MAPLGPAHGFFVAQGTHPSHVHPYADVLK